MNLSTLKPPIVVIDDDPTNFFFLKRELARTHSTYPLEYFSDAGSGLHFLSAQLDAVANRLPALVLLDINMPGENGFDALRWIRAHPALAQLKVAMWTNSEDPKDMQRAHELKADFFLAKGVSAAVLEEILSRFDSPTEVGGLGLEPGEKTTERMSQSSH